MTEIHKLRNAGHLPGEVNTDLVEALRDLLERAERGEITAMAWCHYGDPAADLVGLGWEGPSGMNFRIHSGIGLLYARFTDRMLSEG